MIEADRIIHSLIFLIGSFILIIKSSSCIKNKKRLSYFVPVLLLGITLFIQAIMLYFTERALSIFAQDMIAIGAYIFYTVLFRRIIRGK